MRYQRDASGVGTQVRIDPPMLLEIRGRFALHEGRLRLQNAVVTGTRSYAAGASRDVYADPSQLIEARADDPRRAQAHHTQKTARDTLGSFTFDFTPQRLLLQLRQPFVIDPTTVRLSISERTEVGPDGNTLLHREYRAPDTGRHEQSIVTFDQKSGLPTSTRLYVNGVLQLEREFSWHYMDVGTRGLWIPREIIVRGYSEPVEGSRAEPILAAEERARFLVENVALGRPTDGFLDAPLIDENTVVYGPGGSVTGGDGSAPRNAVAGSVSVDQVLMWGAAFSALLVVVGLWLRISAKKAGRET